VNGVEDLVLKDVGTRLEVNILTGSAGGEAISSQTKALGCGGQVDTKPTTEIVEKLSKIEVGSRTTWRRWSVMWSVRPSGVWRRTMRMLVWWLGWSTMVVTV